ncbi:MAG: hypothetical protein IT436_05870 [Phycisphaerales bacterium]|nr:hypothetical protein [Phycisphaerales bacterium]
MMSGKYPSVDGVVARRGPGVPGRALGVVLAAVAGLAMPALGQTEGAVGGWGIPPADACDRPVEQYGCGKACELRRRFEAGKQWQEDELPWVRTMMREAATATDVLHNNVDLEIIPSTDVITGSNTMTVRSLVAGLTQFTFRLRSNYTITQLLVNGTTPVAHSSVGSYGRLVTLDRAYNAGEEFTLKIVYTGTAVSRGFGSIEFTTQGGQPLVHTLSEAYFAATWWPAKDADFGEAGDNADKATLELAVTAPGTMRTVCNGLLQGVDTLSGGRKKYRWRSDYPTATYLVSFSSTNYNTWTQNYTYTPPGGGTATMPVEFNIFPGDDSPSNRQGWERCIQMMETFAPWYGLYPFVNEKYGIYQFSFGGGMEHQTNTGQGGFGESLTAHELAHQWWGDNVTCRTWNHIWLNEGFATYSEALWQEKKPGSSGAAALQSAMNNRKPGDTDTTVYVDDVSDMNRIFYGESTYLKGGWVLHMLRGVMGDAAFFDTLQTYRNAYGGSGATTEDFRDVASSVYGQDLAVFFDQWVYRTGAPAYAYGYQNVTIAGQPYLRLRLRQTQATTHGIGGVFAMPVSVKVNYSGGSQTYRILNDARSEHFVIPIPAAATSVTIDPLDYILNTGKTSETYAAGPAKIITAAPGPGSVSPAASSPEQVVIGFSANITASAPNFTVTGPSGPVPFTLSYDAVNFRATLAFSAALPAGDYTVSAADDITVSGGSTKLDGEIADPASAASLPSGDGLAGGGAMWTFTVEPATCAVDLNGDGVVDFADYLEFLNLYDALDPAVDFNGDGIVDFADYLEFLNLYDAGC